MVSPKVVSIYFKVWTTNLARTSLNSDFVVGNVCSTRVLFKCIANLWALLIAFMQGKSNVFSRMVEASIKYNKKIINEEKNKYRLKCVTNVHVLLFDWLLNCDKCDQPNLNNHLFTKVFLKIQFLHEGQPNYGFGHVNGNGISLC